MNHELRLTMCAPVGDDPEYYAEVSVDSASGAHHTWAEIYLDNVGRSAKGPRRVEAARAVVRLWFGEDHFDVPLADVLAVLEDARTRLVVGESHMPPE